MAKELPYFRFTVQDWQNGKISLESFELQGLFISICGYYWINDCSITLAMLYKKFRNYENSILELVELDIIKHENKHDKIEIDFLNIQYDLLSEKRKRRQAAGSKGGNAKAKLKQKPSYKDKDNNNNKDKDKDNIPTLEEFCEYGLNQSPDTDLESIKLKYSAWVNNGWKNGNNKAIKNWKSSLTNTLPYLPKNKSIEGNLNRFKSDDYIEHAKTVTNVVNNLKGKWD